MTEEEHRLIDVAILLAQELQEYVDVAIECAGSNSAELATQELLNDWEEAYKAAGLSEEDHFQLERAAAGRTTPWRYPPDMPAEGQKILHTYEHPECEMGPVVSTYNAATQQANCWPIVRWMAVPHVAD